MGKCDGNHSSRKGGENPQYFGRKREAQTRVFLTIFALCTLIRGVFWFQNRSQFESFFQQEFLTAMVQVPQVLCFGPLPLGLSLSLVVNW